MLRSLTLRDFKSFRSAEIPLGPLTLLVGANASGKSNIRDALRVLHGIGLGYPLAEVLGEKYGPGGILQWRGIRGGAREAAYQGGSEFRIEVVLDSVKHDRFGYGLTVNTQSVPRVTAEALTRWEQTSTPASVEASYQSEGGRPDGSWRIAEHVFSSDPEDAPLEQRDTREVAVRLPLTTMPVRYAEFRYPASRPALAQILEDPRQALSRATCAAVLDVLQSLRFLDLDPEAMRQPSQPGQVILGDRGENLSSVLQAICDDEARKQTLLGWVRALTPMDAVDFVFKSDFSGRILVHLVESHGHEISALSASDGTLRFLALVAALLSPDTGRIFFFEELDTGLHPTRLHLLLQLIQQACRTQGVQVIGTTHNPAMLAFLDEQARSDALLVYRHETAPDSRVRRIMDLPDIQSILDQQDLGRLHASGWLEDAAVFSDPDDGEDA